MQRNFVLMMMVFASMVSSVALAQSADNCKPPVNSSTKGDRTENVILLGATVGGELANRGGYSQTGNTAQTIAWTRSNEKISQRQQQSYDYQTCEYTQAERMRINADLERDRDRNKTELEAERIRQRTEMARIDADHDVRTNETAAQIYRETVNSGNSATVAVRSGQITAKTQAQSLTSLQKYYQDLRVKNGCHPTDGPCYINQQ